MSVLKRIFKNQNRMISIILPFLSYRQSVLFLEYGICSAVAVASLEKLEAA